MSFWRKLLGLSEPTPRVASAALADPDEFNDSEPAPEYERYRIARQVVLLRPKEPYARWVHQSTQRTNEQLRKIPEYAKLLDASSAKKTTLAQMRKDCTAYLIELHADEAQTATQQVEYDFEFFFKRELEQWEPQDDGHWPAKLTLALFRQWFELESFDMVLDTTKV